MNTHTEENYPIGRNEKKYQIPNYIKYDFNHYLIEVLVLLWPKLNFQALINSISQITNASMKT